MLRRALLLFLASVSAAWAELDLPAPNPGFRAISQLTVSGNGCGPAALLNAFGFGNAKWQEVGTSIPGSSDRSRLTYVIRGYGLKPSSHLDQLRWTKTRGVSLVDLTDMANEMRGSRWLDKIDSTVFIQNNRESGPKLIRRIHGKLTRSMKKGLPPVLSLQRIARPAGQKPGGALDWRLVHGHFIVLTALPAKLERNATSFPFHYADPWGGKLRKGEVRFDPESHYPAAIVLAPDSDIGKRSVKKGEQSLVTLAAAMGLF